MKTTARLLIFGGWLLASSVAAEPMRHLDPAELDAVTAGEAQSSANTVARGPVTLTKAATNAIARRVKGREDRPGADSYAYGAVGTASGFAAGDGAAIGTDADALTGSTAPYTRTTNKEWSASFKGISITVAFSHTVGKNGAWMLGGGPDD
jgi:hypothetical protein